MRELIFWIGTHLTFYLQRVPGLSGTAKLALLLGISLGAACILAACLSIGVPKYKPQKWTGDLRHSARLLILVRGSGTAQHPSLSANLPKAAPACAVLPFCTQPSARIQTSGESPEDPSGRVLTSPMSGTSRTQPSICCQASVAGWSPSWTQLEHLSLVELCIWGILPRVCRTRLCCRPL
jgi:hypothetical protein